MLRNKEREEAPFADALEDGMNKLKEDQRDQNTLAFSLLPNLLPCPLGDREDVGRVLLPSSGAILGNNTRGVDGQGAIGIERDQEESTSG
jgi:hypothetical protein